MALVVTVEDGTGVVDANSYATMDQVRKFCQQRTVTVPADDDELIGLMTTAMDYLESFEERWKGNRALPATQELSWPRRNVVLFSTELLPNVIPKKIVDAQCYLVLVAAGGVDLNAVQDTRAILEEDTGPLKTVYSATAGATVRPMIPLLDSMISQLCKSGSGMLKAGRV